MIICRLIHIFFLFSEIQCGPDQSDEQADSDRLRARFGHGQQMGGVYMSMRGPLCLLRYSIC